MSLGTFAPGYYGLTYDGDDPGLVHGVRRLRRRYRTQPIQADKFGDTTIDGVYRGGDVFLSMVFKEWNATVRAMLWPFDADFGDLGAIGDLVTDYCLPMVLTAQAASPAAAAGPATITANLAILAPENDVEILLGNEQRDVPVLIQLYPYEVSTGRFVHFVPT